MIRVLNAGLLLIAAALPTSALSQQLVSETVNGNQRICSYGGTRAALTGTDQLAHHRVGIAENCPGTMPLLETTRAAPPTARLHSEQVAGSVRRCVYSHWGSSWTYNLPLNRHCPPAAGMIPGVLSSRR